MAEHSRPQYIQAFCQILSAIQSVEPTWNYYQLCSSTEPFSLFYLIILVLRHIDCLVQRSHQTCFQQQGALSKPVMIGVIRKLKTFFAGFKSCKSCRSCIGGRSRNILGFWGTDLLSCWHWGIFSVPVRFVPVRDAILFHADKHCLSFDLLWRSILASTDRAAIMSSLAGRTAQFLCFAHQAVPSVRTQVSESMTKRLSAQVEANIYFKWKQVNLFLLLQKLPVMLWDCVDLFISFCPLQFLFGVSFI